MSDPVENTPMKQLVDLVDAEVDRRKTTTVESEIHNGPPVAMDLEEEIEVTMSYTEVMYRKQLDRYLGRIGKSATFQYARSGSSESAKMVGRCWICEASILTGEFHLNTKTDSAPSWIRRFVPEGAVLVCSACLDRVLETHFLVLPLEQYNPPEWPKPLDDYLQAYGEHAARMTFWQAASFVDRNQCELKRYCLCAVAGDGDVEFVRM